MGTRHFLAIFSMLYGCSSAKPPPPAPTTTTTKPTVDPASVAADVTIKADAILVGSSSSVVPLTGDRSRGADASLKNGDGNLFIVPLGEALKSRRNNSATMSMSMVVDVDPSTPIRLLSEVLYTSTQCCEVTRWSLRGGAGKRVIELTPPRSHPAMGAPDGLLVFITPTGVSLRGRGGNVATACNELGPGVAVPRQDPAAPLDRAQLKSCAKKVKDAAPDIKMMTVTATPQSIPYSDVYDAIDELRGPSDELFSFVSLGIRRPKD